MKKYWKEILIACLLIYLLLPAIKERFAPCPNIVCITDTVYIERTVEVPTIIYRDTTHYVAKAVPVIIRDTITFQLSGDTTIYTVMRDSVTTDTVLARIPAKEYMDTIDMEVGTLMTYHNVSGWLDASRYRWYPNEPTVIPESNPRDKYFTLSATIGSDGRGFDSGLHLQLRRVSLGVSYDVIQNKTRLTAGYRFAGW